MSEPEIVSEGITFYDRHGRAVAYSPDRTHIYSLDGVPLAYRDKGSVYAFSGEHLGWREHGWIRDHEGASALVTRLSVGAPPPAAGRPSGSVPARIRGDRADGLSTSSGEGGLSGRLVLS